MSILIRAVDAAMAVAAVMLLVPSGSQHVPVPRVLQRKDLRPYYIQLKPAFKQIGGRIFVQDLGLTALDAPELCRLYWLEGRTALRLDSVTELRGRVRITSAADALSLLRLGDPMPFQHAHLAGMASSGGWEIICRDLVTPAFAFGAGHVYRELRKLTYGSGVVPDSRSPAGRQWRRWQASVVPDAGGYRVTRTVVFLKYRNRGSPAQTVMRITEWVGPDGQYRLLGREPISSIRQKFDNWLTEFDGV